MPAPEPGKPRKRGPGMKPLPEARVALPVRVTCKAPEFARLTQARYADMDNKWDVCFEAPWLYLYRGSGYAVFWLRFEPAGEGYAAADAWVTRDPDVIHSDWIGHCGGADEEANAAFLLIKLHGLVYGMDPPPPRELMARWERWQQKLLRR